MSCTSGTSLPDAVKNTASAPMRAIAATDTAPPPAGWVSGFVRWTISPGGGMNGASVWVTHSTWPITAVLTVTTLRRQMPQGRAGHTACGRCQARGASRDVNDFALHLQVFHQLLARRDVGQRQHSVDHRLDRPGLDRLQGRRELRLVRQVRAEQVLLLVPQEAQI